jgi:hypothetical protein
MKHPSQEILALHAGGDLGWLVGWKTARHVAACERCAGEVAAFSDLRDALPSLGEVPELNWNRLAADMRANIRLGLAAGECVRGVSEPVSEPVPLFHGARITLALASILAVVVTGLVLQGPGPGPVVARSVDPVVQLTSHGIQRRSGDQGFALMHGSAQSVTYTVNVKGSLGARYMDPETDQVTMTKVYVE